jgi:hypothetical protein
LLHRQNRNLLGLGTGIGRNRIPLITLKIVVLTAIASPSVMMATSVKPGALRNVRIAYRKSCQTLCIRLPR